MDAVLHLFTPLIKIAAEQPPLPFSDDVLPSYRGINNIKTHQQQEGDNDRSRHPARKKQGDYLASLAALIHPSVSTETMRPYAFLISICTYAPAPQSRRPFLLLPQKKPLPKAGGAL